MVAARLQPCSTRRRALVLGWGSAAAGLVGGVLAVALVLKLAPLSLPQAPLPGPAPAPAGRPAAATAPATTRSVTSTVPPAASQVPSASQRGSAGTSAVRTSAPPAAAFALLSPAADSTPARRDLEFRWREIPNCLYYELEVVTDDGTVVWQARVDGTRARPPADLTLEAGAKYFAWVRAYLKGGETIKSAAVPFHVGG